MQILVQPRDAEEADEAADAAVFASLTLEDARAIVAIAERGGARAYVDVSRAAITTLRRLRAFGLVELVIEAGTALAEFTPLGRKAVSHALKKRVAEGGARGLSR